jgi:hypothetical protein
MVDDQPCDHYGPLAEVGQVLAEFAAFLAMNQEMQDTHVHIQL